jgi:hypothetical protein
LINSLQKILNVPYTDIFIKSIKPGSTIVEGIVSAPNPNQAA